MPWSSATNTLPILENQGTHLEAPIDNSETTRANPFNTNYLSQRMYIYRQDSFQTQCCASRGFGRASRGPTNHHLVVQGVEDRYVHVLDNVPHILVQ